MMKDSRHWGLKKVVMGALLLLNGFVWPKWLGIDGWVKFFAVLMVLFGLVHLIGGCCKKPAGKKKK